ncbi:MAG: HEAT repeat domain-containing protein [Pirellulales bacterium]|nr:HEAT repeat domain-containing protein [Pirellulales bacterium]
MSMALRPLALTFAASLLAVASSIFAGEPSTTTSSFKILDGFSINLVAGPPLVERPITAAFDDQGRLYVADSSGSNDPVQKQLKERPHRIVRLEDTNEDGCFDRSTVFADRMMYPEGTMYYEGALYVSAPPSIWKLTDTNDDGVADDRVEWYQGKTLTGCANDLHGPYLGPDGWVYWCKGAFAEQVHHVNGREWKSRASHIFRCRPDGTGLEPVMTGGMDNPVDVVFTPAGERILSATFLVHPGNGQRDGLIHAVYGGVYGKDHGVLENHPRTGALLPVLTHMNSAAPCGMELYDSAIFGNEFRDNLFVCQFNMHKVSRHVLRPAGSSFVTDNSDFVTSENVDFHPTDVLQDADGSLFIVDTGGWYHLCCPTSQLEKPDVLGGIYRVRKIGATQMVDPRGLAIAWKEQSIDQLWSWLGDGRPVVRKRATREMISRRRLAEVRQFLLSRHSLSLPTDDNSASEMAALARVWALAQIDTPESRQAVRNLLQHPDDHVRQAALHVVSLYRDTAATAQLIDVVANDVAANRRVAAEALGRIGDRSTVPQLLTAVAGTTDRMLLHSIIYALIEIADPVSVRAGIASKDPRTLECALIALDQMRGGCVRPSQVIPLLNSDDDGLRQTARWLVSLHPSWGGELAEWFGQQLASLPNQPKIEANRTDFETLEELLVGFANHPAIQSLLASATNHDRPIAVRQLALQTMGRAKLTTPPEAWLDALSRVIHEGDQNLLALGITAASKLPQTQSAHPVLRQALLAVADNSTLPKDLRIAALAASSTRLEQLRQLQFDLLVNALSIDGSVQIRSVAADAMSRATLTAPQLEVLCTSMRTVGPLEVHRLLEPFAHSSNEKLGLKLIASLRESPALRSLRIDVVREKLSQYGPRVQQSIDELQALVNVDIATQRKQIAELLPQMAKGDVRRGHTVFNSSKAACSACHRMGFVGGLVGPDLSRIGEIRTERDLLESIIFPSLSFVRSFEPVVVVRTDGRSLNGVIRNETASEILLATGPNQEVRIPRGEMDEIHPSTVSVMPAGLDKQLTTQELADLVAFLKNATEQ